MRRGVMLVALLAALLSGCNSRRGGEWQAAGKAQGPEKTLRDGDLLARSRVSPGASAFIVGALGVGPVALMLAAAVALAWRHRRRAREEGAVEARGLLRAGPQCIAGVVEADPGAPGPPVVVYVHQRGTEVNGKGGYSHTWKEASRDVVVRPFHLRREDGLLVRVEADARAMVQADLHVSQRHARDSRTRTAEVRPGARVQVTGEVVGATPGGSHVIDPVYRAAPGTVVVVPPRSGRMVISAEPPGELTRRARFYARWAVGLAIALGAVGGGVLHEYLALALSGVEVQAVATAARRWEEYVKPKNSPGRWVPHYGVRARATVDQESVTVEDECGSAVYDCVRTGGCSRVPFVVSKLAPGLHQVGRGPTLSEGISALVILVTLVLLIAYPASARATRPWWVKSRVVDTGSGRLDAT